MDGVLNAIDAEAQYFFVINTHSSLFVSISRHIFVECSQMYSFHMLVFMWAYHEIYYHYISG